MKLHAQHKTALARQHLILISSPRQFKLLLREIARESGGVDAPRRPADNGDA